MSVVATICPACGDYALHELIWTTGDPPPGPLMWQQTLRAKCRGCEHLFTQRVTVQTLNEEPV